jgi:hypothetical protein
LVNTPRELKAEDAQTPRKIGNSTG